MGWIKDILLLGGDTEKMDRLIYTDRIDAHAYVKGLYYEKSKEVHPDAGGSQEDFNAVAEARARLDAWIKKARRCRICKGKGYIVKNWNRKRCGICESTGQV